MAIYNERASEFRNKIWFIDESDAFIANLQETLHMSGIRPVTDAMHKRMLNLPIDLATGKKGYYTNIDSVVIHEDTARVSLYGYYSPNCWNLFNVILRKVDGVWRIQNLEGILGG